ncbi:MAG TPA: class I SAM-dependent methyltransferase [Candidatus Udaeobacter sp.]|nr:class I SAM-dependent methyltransferase [Candidatus Udaeobacter sp.]
MNLVEIARAAAREARAGRSKLPADFSTEEALSGVKGRALLNNLCGHPGIRLLEIGAYAGSTLASALCGNEIDAVAVDTWYEFIMPSERASRVKRLFDERLARYRGRSRVRVIERSIYLPETAREIGRGINLCFFDADHTTVATERSLLAVRDCLAYEFILLVDDYAMISTQCGVARAIAALGCEVLEWQVLGAHPTFDWYTPEGQREREDRDWWFNYLLAVLRKPGRGMATSRFIKQVLPAPALHLIRRIRTRKQATGP